MSERNGDRARFHKDRKRKLRHRQRIQALMNEPLTVEKAVQLAFMRNAGIRATYALMEVAVLLTRLGGGQFWCLRSDFESVGGFDQSLLLAEDLDFARRLRAHGKHTRRRFKNLRTAPVVASCRKFDRFGDWHMFAMALQVREIRAVIKGTDTAWVDRYFFDFNE